jgi:hypothetical protein
MFESVPVNRLFHESGEKCKPLSVVRSSFVDISLADGTNIRMRTFRKNQVDGSRAGSGLLFVRREHLLQVEGYNADPASL